MHFCELQNCKISLWNEKDTAPCVILHEFGLIFSKYGQTRLKTLFQPQDDENTDKTDKNETIGFFTMTNYNSDIS